MKLFARYLRGYGRLLVVLFVFCFIFVSDFLLYHLPLAAVLYPMLLCAGIGVVVVMFDFLRVRQEHMSVQRIQTMNDAAAENLPTAHTIRDEEYQEIIDRLRKEYYAERCDTERRYTDMVEYYTVWAHQIKTPIASMRLRLQNEDSVLSCHLTSDLRRIEQYVEMVLTFLRLNSESTDYIFRECDLDQIVRSAVKKFSSEFIGRKISLVYAPLHTTVITDEKWLSFVIEQVLSNALKYTPSGSIRISLVDEKTLRIEDTGIGIAPEDLPRIFENGYTGCNGRTDQKASGIGLYLCKRICTNLGHTITAQSVLDTGTIIDIALSQTKLEVE